jgi:hypothetical protein
MINTERRRDISVNIKDQFPERRRLPAVDQRLLENIDADRI